MSIDAGKLPGPVSGGSGSPEGTSSAQDAAYEARTVELREKQTAYRAAVSPEWLAAALGTSQRSAGNGKVAPLPHAKGQGDGAPSPRPSRGKGDGHG